MIDEHGYVTVQSLGSSQLLKRLVAAAEIAECNSPLVVYPGISRLRLGHLSEVGDRCVRAAEFQQDSGPNPFVAEVIRARFQSLGDHAECVILPVEPGERVRLGREYGGHA